MNSAAELSQPLNHDSNDKMGMLKQKKYLDEKSQLISPTDPRRFVYFSFYYIGLTILFPYTMLITIMDFWNFKVSVGAEAQMIDLTKKVIERSTLNFCSSETPASLSTVQMSN